MKLIVLGAKESGTGAALLGKKLGYEVFLSDKGEIDAKYKEILQKEGILFEEGKHSAELILGADIAVKSPGIPETVEIVVELRERGVEVISEIEFAGRHSDAKMICITGSNGKTTTTLLTHHILRGAGIDAGLAGNVGFSLAAQVAEKAHPVYVVELSSFQLDGMSQFKADIGVVTNITPDHLDRYQYKFENYADSKFRILQNMERKGLFIYNMDCPATAEHMAGKNICPEKAGITYSAELPGAGAWMDGDVIVAVLNGRVFRVNKEEVAVKGRHNVYNAMVAILIGMKLGVSDEKLREGLQSFPQVPHRMEHVSVKGGVSYINDSKATNVDSSWYALDSVKAPVVWIAGGTDKGNDYSVLFELVKEKVKLLICMGVDNQKLLESFTPICPVVDTHSLEEAMSEVKKCSEAGDTVLLSPCCASFDLFKSYEDRGDQFREAVLKMED